jgi:hypothetical protein
MSWLVSHFVPKAAAQAKPEPGPRWRPWLGPNFCKAEAASGRAKAVAFGPSRALHITR